MGGRGPGSQLLPLLWGGRHCEHRVSGSRRRGGPALFILWSGSFRSRLDPACSGKGASVVHTFNLVEAFRVATEGGRGISCLARLPCEWLSSQAASRLRTCAEAPSWTGLQKMSYSSWD